MEIQIVPKETEPEVEATARFSLIIFEVAKQFGEVAFEAGEALADTLQAYVPENTGASPSGQAKLKNSIGVYRRDSVFRGRKIPDTMAVVGVWEPHAHFINFGTKHIAANPFFEKAVRQSENNMDQIISTGMIQRLPELIIR